MSAISDKTLIAPVSVGLVLALCGLGAAWYIRYVLGYPVGSSDEHNYAVIFQKLGQGIPWPISGPMFVLIIQLLHRTTQFSHEASMWLLGTLVVPVLVFFLYWIYWTAARDIKYALLTMVILFSSSYFLVGVLQSRPQQVGQFLVLAGCLLLHRNLEGKKRLGMFASICALTAYYHILSFAFLMLAALLFLSLRFILRQVTPIQAAKIILALLPGLLIILAPSGAYQMKWVVILRNNPHLMWDQLLAALAMVLIFASLFIVWARRYSTAWQVSFQRALRRQHAIPIQLRLGVLIAVASLVLSFQYVLLVDGYVTKHAGTISYFFLLQTGNFVFLGLFLWGSLKVMDDHVKQCLPRWIKVFMVFSIIWAIIGLVVLGLTPFVSYKNFLLRLISYAILFAAPIASYGLQKCPLPLQVSFLISVPLLMSLSVMHLML